MYIVFGLYIYLFFLSFNQENQRGKEGTASPSAGSKLDRSYPSFNANYTGDSTIVQAWSCFLVFSFLFFGLIMIRCAEDNRHFG